MNQISCLNFLRYLGASPRIPKIPPSLYIMTCEILSFSGLSFEELIDLSEISIYDGS